MILSLSLSHHKPALLAHSSYKVKEPVTSVTQSLIKGKLVRVNRFVYISEIRFYAISSAAETER
jgi:hypothetical protein